MNPMSRRNILRGAGALAGAATVSAQWWMPAQALAVDNAKAKPSGPVLDTVVFGNAASETAHSLSSELSDIIAGELGQSARVLNPKQTAEWWGGTTAFTLKVDPQAANYVSVKFWGGDYAETADDAWRLQLFLDGKPLGWFDQGVVDNIDMIDVAPRLPGRFFCHTLPLPLSATRGRTSLAIEIRGMGRIWPYGQANNFYYPMTKPSRGLYRAYTHTAPHFTPAANDKFGSVGAPTTRTSTDDDMIAKVRARVLKDQNSLLYGSTANGMDAWAYETLLRGYYWPDSPAYQNATVMEKVCQAIDSRYLAWKKDSKVLTDSDQQWEGFGRVGLALFTGWDDIQDALDGNVTTGPTSLNNLGFEGGDNSPYGWTSPGWASNGTFSRNTDVTHGGSASLKAVSSGSTLLVSPSGKASTGLGDFTYSAWVKTDGSSAHIEAHFWDDSSTYVGQSSSTYVATGSSATSDWQKLTNTFSVPAGATKYEFWMVVTNGETAYFDDVAITSPDPSVISAPLSNLGFEAGSTTPTGWTVPGWANGGSYARDTEVSRTGSASLKMASSGGTLLVSPGAKAVTAAGDLTFSVWAKTDATVTTPRVSVQFWDDNLNFVSGSAEIRVAAGTTDWQQLTKTVTVPSGATKYELWMVTSGGASVHFDDIEITAPQPDAATPVPRRTAYKDMLISSRDYWRQHQRHYTNQAMFTALGIYECNRGLKLLSPDDAWDEDKAMRWVYECVGLVPWRGAEDEEGTPGWPLGKDYIVVTPKGLSRELGYVADYGETSGMLARIYESVTDGKGGCEDRKLKNRMIEMAKARSWFRYPAEDTDGNKAFRIETQIGWRNEPFPGDIVYTERTAWDDTPISATAVFADRDLLGWSQQMIADGQFAPQLELLVSTSLYTRVGLSAFKFVTKHLPAFKKQATSRSRMPAGWDRPDFVFTDEVNACIAVKRGKEILYSSLYWRARQGVNDLARVHLITPQSERSATVRETSVFDKANADTFTVQDWVCWDFAINDSGSASSVPAGGWTYIGPTLHQAFAGETFHLAPVPDDVDPGLGTTTLGVEKVLVGKAPFYLLDYAGYIVAMNTTTDRTITHRLPGTGAAVNLRTGRPVALGRDLKVPPLTTVVLYAAHRRDC
ncbi:Tat pathway signal sequence domain protein [Streptomyces phaeochromogenes]|uniref:Tat pathway signal sequence domain protein n=1 Tax=Streptomyces phaeochromogenes TaxID=1923 RepID=UPI002DDB961F|nr:Tat pathway signal sequence domain protein [Streptomyces phaeochromogenes]WRZ34647.1 Tat pathway signal sequence domain protein [Streptomyces phaeochromogenes]